MEGPHIKRKYIQKERTVSIMMFINISLFFYYGEEIFRFSLLLALACASSCAFPVFVHGGMWYDEIFDMKTD